MPNGGLSVQKQFIFSCFLQQFVFSCFFTIWMNNVNGQRDSFDQCVRVLWQQTFYAMLVMPQPLINHNWYVQDEYRTCVQVHRTHVQDSCLAVTLQHINLRTGLQTLITAHQEQFTVTNNQTMPTHIEQNKHEK